MADKVIDVLTESWMKPIENKDGLTACFIGSVKGHDNIWAVAVHGSDTPHFYCVLHQRVYNLMETCPDCDIASQKALIAILDSGGHHE